MHARFSHIRDYFDGIQVLAKDAITGKRHLERITDMSTFFQKFADSTIVHFYRLPEPLRS